MEENLQRAAQPPRDTIWKWLYRMLQGAIIGTGAILPGISGGVLCVMFGIYRPIMSLRGPPACANLQERTQSGCCFRC